LVPAVYFVPYLVLFYAICGAYDVLRNRGLNAFTLRQYFLGNGVLTWVLSPFNIVLDLLSLPYINKGVYQLEDLPKDYRDEIDQLIKAAIDADLVRQLDERAKENSRTMMFFRWYGSDIETSLDVAGFKRPWKYIETIGVSVFNKRVSTSKHFGYTRASFRLLYNLNDMKDDTTFIVVGDKTNYWRDQKLFIFDDTLLHQSVNQTDETRYCLFVDFIRPTPFPFVMKGAMALINTTINSFKHVLYKNWKVIK
jgi:beta-hydroxylase